MRNWQWVIAAMAVAVVPACDCNGCHKQPKPPPPGPQCAKYDFATAAPGAAGFGAGGGCPPATCGLNGSWLGAGIPFRTLSLEHDIRGVYASNKDGLRIKSFTQHGTPLELRVIGDEVSGLTTAGAEVKGAALVGAVLTIEHIKNTGVAEPPNPNVEADMHYDLTFSKVDVLPYLAEPVACAGASCGDRVIPVYSFLARSSDDCDIKLCKPGIDPNGSPSIAGQAVFFRGDLFDDKTYAVTRVAESTTGQGAVFNIACMGTALSKLEMLRHTAAAERHPHTGVLPGPTEEQTLLRAFTADYCGIGVPFTVDGHPIALGFAAGNELQPTAGSKFQIQAGASSDATWTADGATCLGTPRWSDGTAADWMTRANPADVPLSDRGDLSRIIRDTCTAAGHALTACPPAPAPAGTVYQSANPASP